MKLVIGLTGYSGSGKSMYSEFVRRRFGIPSLTTGDIVRAEVKRRNLGVNPENIARVSDEIRKETGNRFMLIAKDILMGFILTNQGVVIDCLREPVDRDILMEYTYGLKIIGLIAGTKVRYERSKLRKREGDPLTLEEFIALEERERTLGADIILNSADGIITNNGSLVDFYREAEKVTERILGDLNHLPTRKPKRVFISSKIADHKQQTINLELYALCKGLDFDPYLPQLEVPLDTKMSPLEILEANEKAVDTSDIMLMVFDKAGSGSAMEYQRIHMAQKPVIAYRSEESIRSEGLGMMLEGVWQRIPQDYKSSTVEGLTEILKKFR